MPKPQKIAAVADIKERFEDADAALFTEFHGLKVEEMKELRRELAKHGASFKVVKNTLSRIAAREANLEDVIPLLEGSTAIAFIKGDPIPVAKGLDDAAKKFPSLIIKGGLLAGKVFGAEQAQALAKVKPREVLLAQLAGMMRSPIQKLATLLQAPVRDLGYVLGAYLAKLEKESPAPAAPVAVAEAPAEEPVAEARAEEPSAEASAEEPAAEAPAEATTEETTDAPETSDAGDGEEQG